MESFSTDPYPRKEDKYQLAESLNISREQLEKSFRNWRYRKLSEGVIKKGE